MKGFGKQPLRGTFDGSNAPTITYKERDISAAVTPNPIAGAATARKINAIKVTLDDAGET